MVHYSDFHIDSRIQRQARALAERGDEVDLVCFSPNGELRVGDGLIRIHEVPGEKARAGARAYLEGYGRFFAHALWKVSRLAAKRRFDVVEAHNMPDFLIYAGALAKLRGAAMILNVHDTFPELFATKFELPEEHRVVRALRAEEKWSARMADAVIVVTREAGDLLNSRGVGRGRTSVVMNTPDERLFGPQREPVWLPADGQPLRALYHGGLAPRFGVELLIAAVGRLGEQLPELSLRVCGTGSEQAALQALGDVLAPGRVDVAPKPVPVELIPAELEAAQIGVVPTLRDDFTEHLLPVKLLEYVHMGLPAIAPRLPVIENYFSDDELRYFEPGSERDLAAAISEVCGDPMAARARAARASARLAEIDWSKQRAGYLALVDRLARRIPVEGAVKVLPVSGRSSNRVPARNP
jgi:glycosyltransferase involved in cell wall biosynthesis